MERRTQSRLREFYSNWRGKHGEGIIGSSIAVAIGVVGVGFLKREPVDGLVLAVGAYTLSVGFILVGLCYGKPVERVFW